MMAIPIATDWIHLNPLPTLVISPLVSPDKSQNICWLNVSLLFHGNTIKLPFASTKTLLLVIHSYLSIYLSIDRSIDRSIYRSIDLSIYRSIDLSIYRSIDLSIYLSIYLSTIYLPDLPSINLPSIYYLYSSRFFVWYETPWKLRGQTQGDGLAFENLFGRQEFREFAHFVLLLVRLHGCCARGADAPRHGWTMVEILRFWGCWEKHQAMKSLGT